MQTISNYREESLAGGGNRNGRRVRGLARLYDKIILRLKRASLRSAGLAPGAKLSGKLLSGKLTTFT
jgi:hypothetical protein